MMQKIRVDPERYEKIAFQKTISFTANGYSVKFIPEKSLPGFSHKVITVNDVTQSIVASEWLAQDVKVSSKTAEFFYNKHVNGVYLW